MQISVNYFDKLCTNTNTTLTLDRMERKSLAETQQYLKKVIEGVGDIRSELPGNNSFIWNKVNKFAAKDFNLEHSFRVSHGGESMVYMTNDDPHFVYKLKKTDDCLLFTNLLKVYAHNQLFDDCYYEFLGFIYTDKVRTVLRQPLICGKELDNRLQLFLTLRKKGFEYIGNECFRKNKYILKDLYSLGGVGNVLHNEKGIYFIDPKICFDGSEREWRDYILNDTYL